MLQQLTGKAFDTMKFMAEDDSWYNDKENGQKLLDEMNKPNRFGKEEIEGLWHALHRLLYSKLKQPEDDLHQFRNRFEEATRKIKKHGVDLPEEALGFIYLRQAQVDEMTLERIVTLTKGDLKLHAVIDAMRKLKMRLLQNDDDRKKSQVWLASDDADMQQVGPEVSSQHDDDELEVLESALCDLEANDEDQHISEGDAKEILMTLIRQRVQKPVQNFSYKQVQNMKNEIKNGRGFRNPNQNGMKRDIQHLKSITECRNCGRTGHWHRECPLKGHPKGTSANSNASSANTGSQENDTTAKAW